MQTVTVKLTRDDETRFGEVATFVVEDYVKAMQAYGWKAEVGKTDKQLATEWVKMQFEGVLDDDYPDVEDYCVGELIERGFSEADAENILLNWWK